MTSSKYIVFVTTLSVFWPRNVVKRTCYQSAAQQVGLAAPMIGWTCACMHVEPERLSTSSDTGVINFKNGQFFGPPCENLRNEL